MTHVPAYFEAIRLRAASRWDQLEADEELAGPWHQLFKQVQSPRHVLSELLQNADDAGATEASVRVESGTFHFEHNGEDFAEDHFASLCRFGYSNKRALHTIGFRGIGFKSTFSLGDRVELSTPTLSVAFHRARFTEPHWVASGLAPDGHTHVRVAIGDAHRQEEIERNLLDWRESPVSLLFFRNIRRLRIGTHEMRWEAVGPGPTPNSVRMALNGNATLAYLLVTSTLEAFPADALAEIRQERLVDGDQLSAFPPCSVQVVLGTTGRLFVVLPTGVETALPFACNAPFVQDPARLKVKAPESSPTNRWLLARCGELAAKTMVEWLGNCDLPEEERARAYALMPDVDRKATSLEGSCAAAVELAFDSALDGHAVLLSETGDLREDGACVVIPQAVAKVWAPRPIASRFDKAGRPSLSFAVAPRDQQKLKSWGLVDEIDRATVFAVLKEQALPLPEAWPQLLALWNYLAPDIAGYRFYQGVETLKIVPAGGSGELHAAAEVVRLADSLLEHADGDAAFLRGLVRVVHPEWIAFLAAQRATMLANPKAAGNDAISAALSILDKLGLGAASDLGKVFARVADTLKAPAVRTLDTCVRVAQIAAKLSANVASSLPFVTRDGRTRHTAESLYFDADGGLELLLPPTQLEVHLLHERYNEAFVSCTRSEWETWAGSPHSGLLTAPRLDAMDKISVNYVRFMQKLRAIVPDAPQPAFPYTYRRDYPYQRYTLRDYDFDAALVTHFESLPPNASVWAQIVERLCQGSSAAWQQRLWVEAEQTSTNGLSSAPVTLGRLPAAWVRRFRAQPCLRDTQGYFRRPDELFRRTEATEALMGVEPFLHHSLDREAVRPLLDALGVWSTARGPERLLGNLRVAAEVKTLPVAEVDKWYRRLDQLTEACSASDLQLVRTALHEERLVLAHDEEWTTAGAVFLSAGADDVPDVALIRPSVADLALWRRVGVADRPTADLAIAWLAQLPSGAALTGADLRRVKGLLVQYPTRVWRECGHWLNLQGEWVAVGSLRYALTMQSLVPWGHLFPWVKQQTADLQRLSADITQDAAFAGLSLLAACIEERFEHPSLFGMRAETCEWLRTVGVELLRIVLPTPEETQRVRDVALRLATTKYIEVRGLEMVPYIDGTPAGTSRVADVVWSDVQLFVEPQSRAKLAKRIPDELSRPFGRQDIRSALDYCFERPVDDIRAYLRENFELAPLEAEAPPARSVGRASVAAGDSDAPAVESRDPGDAHATDGDHAPPEPDVVAVESDQPDGAYAAAPESSADSALEAAALEAHGAEPLVEATPKPTPSHGAHPDRPKLIERFAALRGFRRNGDEGFVHANGDRLVRNTDSLFPWEHWAAGGTLKRAYAVREHVLERAPLDLDAAVWHLLEKQPMLYGLLLVDAEAVPIEVSGASLRAWRDNGQVTLHAATYRLVWQA